ncbi:hypothetical protein [Kiloniella antarctica]|uniref:Uncharacterized protein n=1 Tax=Kiloniella antarctica TaxID=1550907 RepID=A0ABW5BSG6_9PROT
MNLTRRQLMTSLAALTCATQISSSYASQENKGNHSDRDRDSKDLGDNWSNPGFIRLQTLTTLIQINNIILLTTLSIYFIRILTLGRHLKRTNENRVTIPKSVPLLGSLFRESYEADDFATTKQLGDAYTYDNSLILDLVPNRPQIADEQHPDLDTDLDLNTMITRLDELTPSIGSNFSIKIGTTTYSSERLDLLNDDFSYRLPTTEIKALLGDKHPLTPLYKVPLVSSLFKNRVGEVYGAKNLHVLIRPSIITDD